MQLYETLRFLAECADNNLALLNPLLVRWPPGVLRYTSRQHLGQKLFIGNSLITMGCSISHIWQLPSPVQSKPLERDFHAPLNRSVWVFRAGNLH